MTIATAQIALTFTAQAVVIIGLGSIILHAFYTGVIKPTLDLYKAPETTQYTEEELQANEDIKEAFKLELKGLPIAYEYACPLTCEVPVAKVTKTRKPRKTAPKAPKEAVEPTTKAKRTRKVKIA